MKKIAISQRVEIIEKIDERRDSLSQEWNEFALFTGFIPIFIPNNIILTKKILEEIKIDGIIISGGNDLVNYGGNTPERDETEKFLIDYSLKKDIELLGICRGMQIILDYYGEKLIKVENHVRKEHILTSGEKNICYHNYAIAKIKSEEIKILDITEDNIIEKIKILDTKIFATMNHIERYKPFREKDVEFFKTFFKLNKL